MMSETIIVLTMYEFETKFLKEILENSINSINNGAFQSNLNIYDIEQFCIDALGALCDESLAR